MKKRWGNISRALLLSLIWIGINVHDLYAQDTPDCDRVISYAESEFFNARFSNAADSLEACIEDNLISGDTLFDAHLLRARIYYAQRNEAQAAEAVEAMLLMNPDYRAEPPLPPPFIAFVDYQTEFINDRDVLDVHLSRLPSRPLFKVSRKGWLLIGGGVLATGAALAIFNGGDSPQGGEFPAPPAPPLP